MFDDGGRRTRLRLRVAAIGGVEAKAAVWASSVVVRDVLVKYLQQMSLAEHNQVVKTFATERADHALGDRVGVWGVHRREHGAVPMRDALAMKSAP